MTTPPVGRRESSNAKSEKASDASPHMRTVAPASRFIPWQYPMSGRRAHHACKTCWTDLRWRLVASTGTPSTAHPLRSRSVRISSMSACSGAEELATSKDTAPLSTVRRARESHASRTQG
eukprot:scaffold29269_cov36-Tisochrysis_lutea.AAC.1